MKPTLSSATLVTTLAWALLCGSSLMAQKVAEVENLGDTLVFHPLVGFEELNLTVTGPCNFNYRQRVAKGEPYFRLDETTIDGVYRFELTVRPFIDPEIVEILQVARKKGDEAIPAQLCRDGKLPGDPLVQAAGFRVFEGRIVYDLETQERALTPEKSFSGPQSDLMAPNSTPAPSLVPRDFVILDDLIVDGSACIGFDCVNGESFGFDTLRLKENNLRIKFDDTSTAASFPRNDWQLTANDSANGGMSKFSIDDISGSRTPFTIEANARSHSLYVDDGGRIGSRTSTPSTEIHTIDGDTPTLRLQQDGSSGFAPQTWDVAGNETNFFVRDVTNGSQLPFRIRPDAPTSSIFIDVTGDVGMGTSSPDDELHITRSDAENVFVNIENTNASAQSTGFSLINNASTWNFFNNTQGRFRINRAGVGNVLQVETTGDASFTQDLSVGGDLNVTGTKNFAVADPKNPERWLYFSALEGPEAGTYFRGSALIVDGEAVIELPESFSKLTEEAGLTVQLTPIGGWHQLFVASKSPDLLVVKDAEGSDGVEFDFLIQGVRKGYADFAVERPAPRP